MSRHPTPRRLLALLALIVLAACAGVTEPVDSPGNEETAASAADTEAGDDPEVDTDVDADVDADAGPDADEEPEPGSGHASAADTSLVSADGELEVHYLDVGQGDATLLLHDEAAILIDAGRWQASDVVPMLEARGADALDLVVVTHPHADHLGQFDRVMDDLEVAEVWWSGSETTSQVFERSVSALERSEAFYEEPRAGDTTSIGPLLIEVVNPPVGVNLTDLHDASLSMRITYGEVRLLFTGDAERATEGRMVSDIAATLDADVLQLGHHGSDTSTTAGFLDAVTPSVAIYSAGATNQYGHPHGSVLDRLADADIDVYGTAVHGSVVVTTDGRTWSVGTERDGEVAAAPAPDDEGSSGSDGSSSSDGDGSADEVDSAPGPSPDAASEGCGDGQVDINAADVDELQEIIHIGPARAEDLGGLRPFASVDALDRISGIGPARIDDILAQGVACVG